MQTFEEFKQHFLQFAKDDSPEVLAICLQQYNSYTSRMESSNYFEPFEPKTGEDLISQYEKNLFLLLPFNNNQLNQFSCLIRPSFEPESLLVVRKNTDNYQLSYTILAKNYWLQFYSNNKIVEVDSNKIPASIDINTGDRIFRMVDSAILEAKKPESGYISLDGTTFILSRKIDGVEKSVYKNSLREGTKPQKIIDILKHIAENMKSVDDVFNNKLNDLLIQCDY